jgi:hypothetical protein
VRILSSVYRRFVSNGLITNSFNLGTPMSSGEKHGHSGGEKNKTSVPQQPHSRTSSNVIEEHPGYVPMIPGTQRRYEFVIVNIWLIDLLFTICLLLSWQWGVSWVNNRPWRNVFWHGFFQKAEP